jgi:DNA-binding NtrC family response regulator
MPTDEPSRLPPADQALLGRVILVVEDNVVIAMDIQNAMLEAGALDVFDFAAPEDIERLLADNRIDLAIIDINLDDANRFAVAEMVAAHGSPVILTSAYSHDLHVPALLREAPLFSKPFMMQRLLTVAAGLLER